MTENEDKFVRELVKLINKYGEPTMNHKNIEVLKTLFKTQEICKNTYTLSIATISCDQRMVNVEATNE